MGDTYLPRISDVKLQSALNSSGAVLITGPKRCGKTRTAEEASKSALYVQDPNHRDEYRLTAEIKPSKLLEGEAPRLLDEAQDAPALWNAVGKTIENKPRPGQFILTCSALPSQTGDMFAGTERISRIAMRTMSLYESCDSTGAVSLKCLFEGKTGMSGKSYLTTGQLACVAARGGWPEAVVEEYQKNALKIPYKYLDAIVHIDISETDGVARDPDRVYSLTRSISRNLSDPAETAALVRDLQSNGEPLSNKTVDDYISALKNIFIVEDLPAWRPFLRSKRAVRTTAKRYLTDPSLAAAALNMDARKLQNDSKYFSRMFKSLCVRDLRIYSDAVGGNVYHYRDQLNVEIDAITQLKDGSWGAVAFSMGAGEIKKAADNLLKFSDNIDTRKMPGSSFLMVLTGTEYAFQMKNGVWVVPLGCLRD